MPVQRFAPMTKDFATFDCDAHVTEPPLIWERAHEFLTRDELDALKQTIWWDAENRLLVVNGRAGVGLGSPRKGGIPGTMRVITNAGPGVKHDIQRALNVRSLNPKTALTQQQVAYLDHAGSYEPKPPPQPGGRLTIQQVVEEFTALAGWDCHRQAPRGQGRRRPRSGLTTAEPKGSFWASTKRLFRSGAASG